MASSTSRAREVLAAAATTLGVVLLPKCPLCIAAYLAGIGASAGTAALLAPWARPAAWSLLAVSLGSWLFGWLRRRKLRASTCCH
jgi:hypothetical protein